MGKPKTNWDYLVDSDGNYVGGSGGGGGVGPAGPQGPIGPAGPTGATGASIPGPAGPAGPVAAGAFIFKGNVANAAALPTTGNVLGDSYVQQDNNELVVWDGTAFVGQGTANTTTAKGDTGATGPVGPTGPAGAVGPIGPIGPAGADGNLPLISTLPALP